MKVISHSEISTYLSCQKKWELTYKQGIRIDNEDFQFGTMAHSVMETNLIPPEELYPMLKEHFGIQSWENYFKPILEFIKKYTFDNGYDLIGKEIAVENDTLKGFIDVVYTKDDKIMICDYKFTKNPKTYDDLINDEQLYIYAYLYSQLFKKNINDIEIGYFSFPKVEYSQPRKLANGGLSKDKAQYTTYELYKKAIEDNNLDINDYAEILDYLYKKQPYTFIKTAVNVEKLIKIMDNINNVITDMQKDYVLEKNGYDCKYCPYKEYCKK